MGAHPYRKRACLEALKLATTKLTQRGTGYPSWGHPTQPRISKGSTSNKTNDYIRRELRITSILDKIDEYRRNWLSHLQRMTQNRIALKSYHYRPPGWYWPQGLLSIPTDNGHKSWETPSDKTSVSSASKSNFLTSLGNATLVVAERSGWRRVFGASKPRPSAKGAHPYRKRACLEALKLATTKLTQRGTGYPSWGQPTQLRISRGSPQTRDLRLRKHTATENGHVWRPWD